MLFYFILFSAIGFAIGKTIDDSKNATIAIVVIAIFWGVFYAPIWGLVSLGELFLGYIIAKNIR